MSREPCAARASATHHRACQSRCSYGDAVKPLYALLAAGAVAGAAHHQWAGHDLSRATAAMADGNGFVPAQMPDGAAPDSVLILAPVNCPHEGARRADALAQRLQQLGIPAVRSNHYSVARITPDNAPSVNRAVEVLRTEMVPVVFVNGRAKANPTSDEVVAEYRQD